MVKPCAQTAVYHKCAIASFYSLGKAQRRIGIVFFAGMAYYALKIGNVAERVEIAHNKIGSDAHGFKRGKSAVGGNDLIAVLLVYIHIIGVCGTDDVADIFHLFNISCLY